MPTTATAGEHGEHVGADEHAYHYTRTVTLAGRTVRARLQRGHYLNDSYAVAEVRDETGWASLSADDLDNWFDTTPAPSLDIDAAAVLGPLADRLLGRVVTILAVTPTAVTVSPHVHGAISALLATMYGYDAEHRIDPDDVAWADNHGGRLHILEHPDGAVTFTKAHRESCPYLTSRGAQECDEECDFEHPAVTAQRGMS